MAMRAVGTRATRCANRHLRDAPRPGARAHCSPGATLAPTDREDCCPVRPSGLYKRQRRGVTTALLSVSGRGERIRTSGLYVPNVALYQAKLHPEGLERISAGRLESTVGRESRQF